MRKVFKDGPSKSCRIQRWKNLQYYGLFNRQTNLNISVAAKGMV